MNRVIPNLLAVRARQLDLAVAGTFESALAVLDGVGRMIGRPFDPPIPLWLWLSDQPRGETGDAQLQPFKRLFRICDRPALGRRWLLLVALAPEALNESRLEALLAQFTGAGARAGSDADAGGLAVVPAPADGAQRRWMTQRLLQANWLPIFVDAPAQRRAPEVALGALDSDHLGRIIHELFLENAWTRGERLGSTPALHPWRRLDETYRQANRSQAAHIACKLACGGLIAIPEPVMADGQQAPLWSRPEFIEPLSRMEHDRWASDRLLDGWVYGARRDNAARHHPDLIPYDDLSEAIREKDRVAVATIPFILQLGACGWRPLATVQLAGRWPDPNTQARWRRRWRADLRRVVEERAPAVLEFQLNPAVWEECQLGLLLAECGFPLALRLSAPASVSALATDAAHREALLGCLTRCRRVLWADDAPHLATSPLPALSPQPLEVMLAEGGGLRVERHGMVEV